MASWLMKSVEWIFTPVALETKQVVKDQVVKDCQDLMNYIEDLRTRVKSLLEEKKMREYEVTSLKHQIEAIAGVEQKLTSDTFNLKREMAELITKLAAKETIEQIVEGLRGEILVLAEDKRKREIDMASLTQILQNLAKTEENLMKDADMLKLEIMDLSEKLAAKKNLEVDVKDLHAVIDTMTEEKNGLGELINSLRKQNDNTVKVEEKLTTDIEQLKLTIVELTSRIEEKEEYESQVSTLKARVKEMEEEAIKLRMSNTSMSKSQKVIKQQPKYSAETEIESEGTGEEGPSSSTGSTTEMIKSRVLRGRTVKSTYYAPEKPPKSKKRANPRTTASKRKATSTVKDGEVPLRLSISSDESINIKDSRTTKEVDVPQSEVCTPSKKSKRRGGFKNSIPKK